MIPWFFGAAASAGRSGSRKASSAPAYHVFQTDSTVNPDFLEALLRWPGMLPRYADISQEANVRRRKASFEDFGSLSWNIPPLSEQRKIAEILSSMDDTIEKTQAVIDQLEVVKKGLLGELITRGVPGRHNRFVESEVGLLPSGWQCVRLGDLVVDSRYGTSTKCNTDTAGLPVLRIPNVLGVRIDPTELKYARLPSEEIARLALQKGDSSWFEPTATRTM